MTTKCFGFYDIEDTNITELNLVGQPIISFEGISRLTNLKKLNIQNTLISSFKGADFLPNLEEIDFRNTVLNRYSYVREMCLFAFNLNLKTINGIDALDERNRCKDNPQQKTIEDLVRKGSFIILNPKGTFIESTSKVSYETTIKLKNYNKNNSINSKTSTENMINNLYQYASEMRKIRIENHDKQTCFKFFSARKYNSDSTESLQNELNSLKPPIENLRDQIRLEEQKKKDTKSIYSLQAQLLEIQQKLQRTQLSLNNANDSINRLQDELKSLYSSQSQTLIDQLNNFCAKLNENKNENNRLNKLISENEILTSKLEECKEASSNKRSLEFDLNKILEDAENLKSEKEKAVQRLESLRSKIKAQNEEIEKLTSEEKDKSQQNDKLGVEIDKKLKEKEEIQRLLDEAIACEKEEKKKLAAEFEKTAHEISNSVANQKEPTIDDLTSIPPV